MLFPGGLFRQVASLCYLIDAQDQSAPLEVTGAVECVAGDLDMGVIPQQSGDRLWASVVSQRLGGGRAQYSKNVSPPLADIEGMDFALRPQFPLWL